MRTSNGYACRLLPAVLAFWLLSSCGGGGGGGDEGTPSAPITSFELLDPTPLAGNGFGSNVVILANGNIVVTSPSDSSVANANGAVHLYNPVTQTRIASIYGDAAGDQLGSGGVTALSNGNFVIVSPVDDVGGIIDAGSVQLVDGMTGAQIGAAVTGDTTNDLDSAFVVALPNGNFVIVAVFDDEGGVVDAGSVRLVNGATGAQIGAAIAGDAPSDVLGIGGVTALANGNFVIASPFDDVGGIVNAGSVRLVNGTTGAQIGAAIRGSDVTVLANGNFVIASPNDDVGGIVDAGSVRVVDGATGVQIGAAITGDAASDFLGSRGITALANGNFVIASPFDDVGGIVDAGSVRLVNGTTGVQIGAAIAGDTASDLLGVGGVTVLTNGNFVINALDDNVGGIVGAGSVRLVNGTTGAQIGAPIAGDAPGDRLGSSGVTALANGNFVIASSLDDVDGVVDAGSVRLVNGTTGAQIGAAIAGDAPDDQVGSGVTALANGNFFIVSPNDDVGGIVDAGSVRLVDGATGAQIGSAITGSTSGDLAMASVVASATGSFYILTQPRADKNGLVDSGMVRLIAP